MIRKQNTITGSVIYSHFRHLCPYHTWLLFNVGVTEVTPAPSDRLLMDTGIRHEDEALIYFKEQLGDECVEIPTVEGQNTEQDMALRAEKTVLAMEEGKQVIYHGILAPDDVCLKTLSGRCRLISPCGAKRIFFSGWTAPKTANGGRFIKKWAMPVFTVLKMILTVFSTASVINKHCFVAKLNIGAYNV